MLPDGNCLFRAVADQVYGDADLCDRVREQAMNHEEAQRAIYASFVDEPFDNYVARLRRGGEVADHLEIQAMAEVYCRPIEVYAADSGAVNVFHCGIDKDNKEEGKEEEQKEEKEENKRSKANPPIRLLYVDGNHYNSIVDNERPAVGVGLGLPGLEAAEEGPEARSTALALAESDMLAAEQQLLKEALKESSTEMAEKELLQNALKESLAQQDKDDDEEQLMQQAMAASEQEILQAIMVESLVQAFKANNNNNNSNN